MRQDLVDHKRILNTVVRLSAMIFIGPPQALQVLSNAMAIEVLVSGSSGGRCAPPPVVPGLLTAAALSLVVYNVSCKRGYGGQQARSTGKQRLTALYFAIPALLLPLLIVGGVRFGVFTATEAGAMTMVLLAVTYIPQLTMLTVRWFGP